MTSHSQVCPITAEQRDDGMVLRFSGRNVSLDEQATEAFREQVSQLIEVSAPLRLTMDFSNVNFLSSTTLGVLVGFRNKLHALGGQLTLAHLEPQLHELFVLTQLDRLFDIR